MFTDHDESTGEREENNRKSEIKQIVHNRPPFELSVCSCQSKWGQEGWKKGQENIKKVFTLIYSLDSLY